MPMINSESNQFGIIHLSDIHFSSEKDFITAKFDSFFNSLKDDFLDCGYIFVVISGDIANHGFDEEYSKALDFLSELYDKLSIRYKSIVIRSVFIPGNHDCNFSFDSQLRQNTIKDIYYDKLGSDNSVIDTCINVQGCFWNFYALYNEVPETKLYYKIIEKIQDKKICFHCFNTAWMSQIKEKAGTLFYPIKVIPQLVGSDDFNLNIALFHHPIGWLNPNTKENNRREFQNVLDTISSLQIIGHEHENELRKSENIDIPDSKTLCATGEIMQDLEKPEISGFQTFLIDLDKNSFRLNRYRWEKDIYKQYSSKELSLEKKPQRSIELQESFKLSLNELDLPLSFGNKKASLSDLYVYPHLEDMNKEFKNKMEDYVDSSKLLQMDKEGTYILEGESQIGKSSLLKRLAFEMYEKGYYPVLLNAKKISNDNVERQIKEVFRSQYINKEDSYDRYRQLPKDKKVLLIDDFHSCRLYKEQRNKLLEGFSEIFKFVFVAIDTAHVVLPQYQSSFKNAKFYSIKPLGYAKRNLLVEKYIQLSYSDTDGIEGLFIKVRDTFDKLTNVLGNKFIPSFPVFVLTIIQSLEYTPLNLNETSYGYCYHTLIHLALSNSGVHKDHIDSFINFLTELAFEIFNRGTISILDTDFESFYDQYRTKYWAPNFDLMKDKLLKSKVIKNEHGEYQFGYIYILYFLSAKKIAEIIDRDEGKKIVSSLLDNLHTERHANILVFITHHTKSEKFILEAILSAMLPFDGISPISLEKNCLYNKLLKDIVKEIKNDVIEMRDPTLERNKLMIEKDRFECENEQEDLDPEEIENNIHLRPFLQAFRSIEIVGQIIKNRKGSLETCTIKEMIRELYYTGFRMMSYFGELIKNCKEDLTHKISEKVKKQDSTGEIERKIFRFLEFISLQACLGIFAKIIQNVGVKELHQIFNEVANDINTPAAHLVSFSINSYYDKLNIKELEKLSIEFKDNMVALQILRSRVKAYIYNNHVDYKLKQKIGAYLNMDVSVKVGRLKQ
jgi:hypothetical protein